MRWAILLLVAACGGSQPTESEPPPPPTDTGDEAEPPSAAERMREHFHDVALARDAVIAGDLEGVRAPLTRIAAADYGDDLPGDWRDWVAEMQESAAGHVEVAELRAAAGAVASLTESCADCHRTTLGGPAIPEAHQPETSHDLAGQMARHAWGTEQLWLGLTAPSHEAWARGAAAIIEDPMTPEDEELDPELADDLEEVRELAQAAADAGQPAAKADAYAALLAKCASCHAQVE